MVVNRQPEKQYLDPGEACVSALVRRAKTCGETWLFLVSSLDATQLFIKFIDFSESGQTPSFKFFPNRNGYLWIPLPSLEA